ncbi:MAG: hypothetical protein HY006_03195 [Candidatus Sungbacteria bacterium]|nr:hypothetical protein [Candidatus Sungbacteria bacterium]
MENIEHPKSNEGEDDLDPEVVAIFDRLKSKAGITNAPADFWDKVMKRIEQIKQESEQKGLWQHGHQSEQK